MSKSWKMLGAAVVMVGGMSSVAIADGYEYEPVTDYAPPPPVFSWTGTYAGFNAGWIRNESSSTLTGQSGFPGSGLPGRFNNDSDGFLAGLTLGYNGRMGAAFVGGVEADIAYTDIDASGTNSNTFTTGTFPLAGTRVTASETLSRDMQWFGTVRARAGWLASRDLLVYATGGLAYANVERSGSRTVTTVTNAAGVTTGTATVNASGSGSDWKTGWTVGGGFEWLMGNKTTFKTEYLYYDLDDSSVTLVSAGNSATYKSENTGHIVRMGLNVALY